MELAHSVWASSQGYSDNPDLEERLDSITSEDLEDLIKILHTEGHLERQALELLYKKRPTDLRIDMDARTWKLNNQSIEKISSLQGLISLNLAGSQTFNSNYIRHLNGEIYLSLVFIFY